MIFLNSAFLFALGAVAIPLIIHFLSKRRIKTIEFSSLKFLEEMQKNRMKWLKVKEMLLLLLRMLVIALIVMAFARPTIRGFIGSSKAASSVVIVMDRSASMDADGETGTIFDESKRLAGRLLDTLEPDDMVTIVSFPQDGTAQVLGPVNPGPAIRQRLSRVELGYQTGNIGDALKTALDILDESPDLNREIYIFSDMQNIVWKELPPDIINTDSWKDIRLFVIPQQSTGADNIGITDILMPPQLLVPGENFVLEAEMTNYGKGTVEDILVGVVVDGEREAQATATLRPGRPSPVRLTFRIDTPGDHGGFVEIDYDKFGLDNRRYFSIYVPEKIKLLAVAQTANDLNLLEMVLDRQEAGQIEYKGIGAVNLLREDISDYDIMLLYNIKSLDQARAAAISRFIEGGGGLYVSLGKSSDSIFWDRFLRENTGISLGALMGESGEYIVWDEFDYEHPIFNIYSGDDKDRSRPSIPDMHIEYYRNLSGGAVLGWSSGGINLLTESSEKPVLVYASGLDFLTGDLPAHSFFIPFLIRCIEYLGSRDSNISFDGIVGEPIQWKIKGDVLGELSLISPSGSVMNLQATDTGTGVMVGFTEYGPPGIYTLKSDDETITLMAFNIDRDESDGDMISSNDIAELLGARVETIEPSTDLKKTIKEARFGREFWREFLVLALILLIVESILGKTSPPLVKTK